MTVLRDLCRFGARFVAPAALAAALLAGCGGGSSQVETFRPSRVIVFGDETSLLVDDGANNGKKYSVNGLNSSTSLRDCTVLPLWTQAMATLYGFVFSECNPDSAAPKAYMRALAGAKIDDPTTGLAQQISNQASSGGELGSRDLVTVMIGANDLYELFDMVQAGTMTHADAVAEAGLRGKHAAGQINAILSTGARAIVATVPDLSLSPYVLALQSSFSNAKSQMYALVYEYNAYLRSGIDSSLYDGRNYGLVVADDLTQAMVKSPSNYSLTNVVDAACKVALPACTSASDDLVTDATAAGYLWADAKHLGPTAHTQLGSRATSRATGNPF